MNDNTTFFPIRRKCQRRFCKIERIRLIVERKTVSAAAYNLSSKRIKWDADATNVYVKSILAFLSCAELP